MNLRIQLTAGGGGSSQPRKTCHLHESIWTVIAVKKYVQVEMDAAGSINALELISTVTGLSFHQYYSSSHTTHLWGAVCIKIHFYASY